MSYYFSIIYELFILEWRIMNNSMIHELSIIQELVNLDFYKSFYGSVVFKRPFKKLKTFFF